MAKSQVTAPQGAVQCKSCEREHLTARDFYASNLGTCKECVKAQVRKNRAEKLEYYRAYDRQRYREDPKRQEHCKAMGKTTPMAERVRKQRERRQREPEKNRARVLVYRAVKSGQLERKPCFFCGASHQVQAHHQDYTRPLDVTWLCPSCHGKLHALKGDFHRGSAA